MANIKLNVVANLAGRGWSSLMNIVFVPFYIKLMGIEAYGLVGFFATLTSIFYLLDFGFSTTLNREIAILSDNNRNDELIGNTTRSFEIVYWSISISIFIITFLLAPLVAHYWVNPEHLSVKEVENAIRMMGFVIALRFPFALYSGGMMGLQRQVALNIVVIFQGTIRGVGVVLILWLVSPTIQAFFVFHAILSLIETVFIMFLLWRNIPYRFTKARFSFDILKRIARFAGGLSGIGITGMLLSQIDKIILSKFVTLDIFGYYSLASTVATGLLSLVSYPVYNAVFPRLSQLLNHDPANTLSVFYHKSCQLVSALMIPICIVVISFSKEILYLWTMDKDIADNASVITSLLLTGALFNGFMHIPIALQISGGKTNLILYYNIFAVAITTPTLIILSSKYGAIGAAITYILINFFYIIINLPLMHRHFLIKEKSSWFLYDTGLPLLVGIITTASISLLSQKLSLYPLVGCLLSLLITMIAVALTLPQGRNTIAVLKNRLLK